MKELAKLLFPNVTKTKQDLIKIYPKRKEGVVVTRLAPSPTGFLHIGGIYTALANKKFASQNNGTFMLRIEDTDKKREVDGSIDIITKTFKDLDITIDEGVISKDKEIGNYGPYTQSHRVDIYHILAFELVEKGLAYPCFCNEEELNSIREIQVSNKLTPGYYKEYAKCRNLTLDEIKTRLANNDPYVLRFKVDSNVELRVGIKDIIKGEIELDNNINDFVLLKTDKIPTYHFAHAVDDSLMYTTHVIRGDEWISSLPIHIQLFNALDFKIPFYGHVAPIMKLEEESRRKLSKRKDPESSAMYYLEKGYPKRSVYVYLYTLLNSNFEEWYLNNLNEDLSKFEFTFENMGVSGPLYDLDKLNSISSVVIYNTSIKDNIEKLLAWAKEYNIDDYNRFNSNLDFVKKIFETQGPDSLEHRKDLCFYSDFMNQFGFLYDDYFKADTTFKEHLHENVSSTDFPIVKEALINYFKDKKNGIEKTIKELSKELNYTDKKKYEKDPSLYRGLITNFYHTLRLLVTHKTSGISMDDVVNVLGIDEVISRIENSTY
ncbi:MAG: glutamate--tRNA ligase [Anaeroplasmataceae bacterium]